MHSNTTRNYSNTKVDDRSLKLLSDNRERAIAQSFNSRGGNVATLPSIHEAREVLASMQQGDLR